MLRWLISVLALALASATTPADDSVEQDTAPLLHDAAEIIDIENGDIRRLTDVSPCDQFLSGIAGQLPSGITGCGCLEDGFSIECHRCDFTIDSQSGFINPTATLTPDGRGIFTSCADLTSPDSPPFCMEVTFVPGNPLQTSCTATYAGEDCETCVIEFCAAGESGGFGNNMFGFTVNCANVAGGFEESTCDMINPNVPFSVALHAVYEAENHLLECKEFVPPSAAPGSAPAPTQPPFDPCQTLLTGIEQSLPVGLSGCECIEGQLAFECELCEFTIASNTGILTPSGGITQEGGVFKACADLTSPDNPPFCMEVIFVPQNIGQFQCKATYGDEECASCTLETCEGEGFGFNNFGFAVNCTNIDGGGEESTCADMDIMSPFSIAVHAVYEADNHVLTCGDDEPTSSPVSPPNPCRLFLDGIVPALPEGVSGCSCAEDEQTIDCQECEFTIEGNTGTLIPTARLTAEGGEFKACADLTNPDGPELCMTVNFQPSNIQNTVCDVTYDGEDCTSCGIEFCQNGGFGDNQFGFVVDCSNVPGGAKESTCGNIDTSSRFSVALHAVYEAENHDLDCKLTINGENRDPASVRSSAYQLKRTAAALVISMALVIITSIMA